MKFYNSFQFQIADKFARDEVRSSFLVQPGISIAPTRHAESCIAKIIDYITAADITKIISWLSWLKLFVKQLRNGDKLYILKVPIWLIEACIVDRVLNKYINTSYLTRP
jgi:hypothetical protein